MGRVLIHDQRKNGQRASLCWGRRRPYVGRRHENHLIRHLALAIGTLAGAGCGGARPRPGTPARQGTREGHTGAAAHPAQQGAAASGAAGKARRGVGAQPTAATPSYPFRAPRRPVAWQATGGPIVWTWPPAGRERRRDGGELHASGPRRLASMSGIWPAPCIDMSKYTGGSSRVKAAPNTSESVLVPTPRPSRTSSTCAKRNTVGKAYAEVSVPFEQLERAQVGAG